MTRDTVFASENAEALFRRLRAVVSPDLPPQALDPSTVPATGDHSLNDWVIEPAFLAAARIAAVLIGLRVEAGVPRLLLTQRTAGLRDHAGQVAFPGGKMDAGDASPAVTALREAHEEVGLPPENVEVLGYLDPYLTRTGFRIIPVVARIAAPFDIVLNAGEVVDAFEVPFDVVMDLANYRLMQREWLGTARYFYTIAHGERTIWGATAGILHILSERLAAS